MIVMVPIMVVIVAMSVFLMCRVLMRVVVVMVIMAMIVVVSVAVIVAQDKNGSSIYNQTDDGDYDRRIKCDLGRRDETFNTLPCHHDGKESE